VQVTAPQIVLDGGQPPSAALRALSLFDLVPGLGPASLSAPPTALRTEDGAPSPARQAQAVVPSAEAALGLQQPSGQVRSAVKSRLATSDAAWQCTSARIPTEQICNPIHRIL